MKTLYYWSVYNKARLHTMTDEHHDCIYFLEHGGWLDGSVENENDITRANSGANKKSNPKQKVKLNKQCCNLTKKGIRCKHKCKYVSEW